MLTVLAALLGSDLAAGVDVLAIARMLVGPQFPLTFSVAIGALAAAVDIAIAIEVLRPTLRWFASGALPTARQRARAVGFPWQNAVIRGGLWVAVSMAIVAVQFDRGMRPMVLTAITILLGGAAACFMGYLVTERVLRQVFAAALTPDGPLRRPRPSVVVRLMVTWGLFSGIPLLGVAGIVMGQYVGWEFQNIGMPVLVAAVVGLAAGARAMSFAAKSISDPLRDVTEAMAKIGAGDTDTRTTIYDTSEIGALQSGFNSMAVGIAERERLADLFGRHVGRDVAAHALEHDGLTGAVEEAAMLFVDLTGSTAFAATNPPDQVATLLNTFCAHVVTAVDDNGGFVNKFEGDAVLAVFGVPIASADAAGAALAAARTIRDSLAGEPGMLEFGIGVSYGKVFAGNIGAENRYEYTVIGDPVNEAARLSGLAKTNTARILATEVAVLAAHDGEAERWRTVDAVTLRGRTAPTAVAELIR